jgi:opacity protein-like surface antigen
MNKVQKLLLACLASSALLPSMAVANTLESASSNSEYYLTFGGGPFLLNKSGGSFSDDVKQNNKDVERFSYKKPKMGYEFMLGAGYNVAEGVRLELVFIKPMVGDTKITLAGNAGGSSYDDALALMTNEKSRHSLLDIQYKNIVRMDGYAQAYDIFQESMKLFIRDADNMISETAEIFNNRYTKDQLVFAPYVSYLPSQEIMKELIQDNTFSNYANKVLQSKVESFDESELENIQESLDQLMAFIKQDMKQIDSALDTILRAQGGANGSDKDLGGKITAQINSVQLRAYVDVFDISDYGKAYVGAGLGWAQVKAKMSSNYGSGKTKNKNNLAWFVGFGAAFNVADGTRLAVEYNYQDFGSAKFNSGEKFRKKSFAGHAVIAKLMFDI